MQVSYEEDLANHFGLLQRAGIGNDAGLSVWTEGNAGQPTQRVPGSTPFP